VKTIVNLEDDLPAVTAERAWAKAASITQISSPMSGGWTPNDRQVDQLLATLADPAKRPLYVHCKKGMDRTGVIVALHRVINEQWTPTAAAHERDAIGFNGWLFLLDRYYSRKAGEGRRHPQLD
jgi:protein tyrosine/serine phosphatase